MWVHAVWAALGSAVNTAGARSGGSDRWLLWWCGLGTSLGSGRDCTGQESASPVAPERAFLRRR